MRRIAIINQKGGVGKTTTAVNLAAALAECGQRVCVLDLDPQAHATTHLGIEPDGKAPSMYEVLVNSRPLADVRKKVADNLWLAASDINLAAAEVELAGVVGREVILRDLLLQDEGAFDFVILSQTLQETRDPLRVLRGMLRIGRRAVVAFPNFGHWTVRLAHLWTGRAPKTELFPHDWFDSPNIHFLTVLDFEALAEREHWRVERRMFAS